MRSRKYAYYYERNKLVQVSGHIKKEDNVKLKILAKEADKSKNLYLTRLIEKHIHEQWAAREAIINPPSPKKPKT